MPFKRPSQTIKIMETEENNTLLPKKYYLEGFQSLLTKVVITFEMLYFDKKRSKSLVNKVRRKKNSLKLRTY